MSTSSRRGFLGALAISGATLAASRAAAAPAHLDSSDTRPFGTRIAGQTSRAIRAINHVRRTHPISQIITALKTINKTIYAPTPPTVHIQHYV